MTHVWANLFSDNSNTRNLALFFYAALWLQRGWFMISFDALLAVSHSRLVVRTEVQLAAIEAIVVCRSAQLAAPGSLFCQSF
jgi:hypothetical protein